MIYAKRVYLSLFLGILIVYNLSCSLLFKDSDNKSKLNNLLSALVLLQTYEATVTVVGFMAQTDGKPIRDGRVEILNADGKAAYLAISQGNIREFTKCQTTNPASVDTTTQNGQFTITFKVTSANGSLGFKAIRHKNGTANQTQSCNNIANFLTEDYTLDVGTALWTINVKNNKDLDQLTVSEESGLKLTIKSVETVVRGTYNLQNPTLGESYCDGDFVNTFPEVLSGSIRGTKTITNSAQLQGTVTVESGATLVVSPGTVIFGNRGSSLFVLPGGKLIADGTATQPICWTSSQARGSRFPGDWGGIVLVGNAKTTRTSTTEGTTPINYGGGSNDADSSGTLRYNIIEFAGSEVAPGDELNSLSMYAVGSGTIVDYVQVHRSLDDGFEAWGGAVNLTHVVATGGLDDDYDFDEGYIGSLTYAISQKYPTTCGGSPSTDPHMFEMDGIDGGNFTADGCTNASNLAGRCTSPNINFVTGIGALISGGEGARFREGFRGTVSNTMLYNVLATNLVIGGGNPTTTPTINDTVYFQQGKTTPAAHTARATLTQVPIVSEGDVNGCGFGANKPDFTTNPALGLPASVGASGNGAGKWWENWTVYRAR
jgi:hypothetical protein